MNQPIALEAAEALFARFCLPWYSPADLQRRGHTGVRPDLEVDVAPPLTPARRLHTAPPEALHYVRQAQQALLDRAVTEWTRDLQVSGTPSLEWLDAFDRRHDPARVAALVATSDPERRDNAYIGAAASLAAVLGAVLCERVPRAAWLLESPGWESAVYDARSSSRANIFHWALRRLSADGVDHGLRAKLLEVTTALEQQAGGAATK